MYSGGQVKFLNFLRKAQMRAEKKIAMAGVGVVARFGQCANVRTFAVQLPVAADRGFVRRRALLEHRERAFDRGVVRPRCR